MSCAGVNIGALSLKAVALHGERRDARVALHCGRPVETLRQMLAEAVFAGVEFFGVSGQLGHITEVAAIRRATRPNKWLAKRGTRAQGKIKMRTCRISNGPNSGKLHSSGAISKDSED